MRRTWRWLAVSSLCAGALLAGSGCRSKPIVRAAEGGEAGADPWKAEIVRGDHPLKTIDELGIRIDGAKFDSVLFAFDSAQVRPDQAAKIEAVAQYLKTNAGTRALLEGHCDERGTTEYNMALGERRALAIRTHMIHLGIDVARLVTRSMGEEKPASPGHEESAWRMNRRVEIALYR